jgi:peptidoglycan/xylan/chitin deacetylase (PgdA/CDA1 family)
MFRRVHEPKPSASGTGNLLYRSILGGIGAVSRLSGIHHPTIFCFHSVRARGAAGFQSELSVSEDFLEGLILSLRKLAIPILPLGEAVERIRNADLRPFVVLTFDDGYVDNYTTLYPLMARFEVPFTIFVTTGLVDRTTRMWWDALERLTDGGATWPADTGDVAPQTAAGGLNDLGARLKRETVPNRAQILAELIEANPAIGHEQEGGATLSWSMLREMRDSGLLTVGSHTVNHPMLGGLDVDGVQTELSASRARLEEMLDCPIDYLAYPFGQQWEIGPHSASAAERAGYKAAFTTEARSPEAADADRAFLLPRILLSSKAVHPDIALAYMSGVPARLNRMAGRR